jgi:metal-responsive CopG/Arc/MetJ family transcriptional regulator
VNVLFDDALLKQIEEYWHANRIPSRTEAIRVLVKAGLGKKPAKKKGK